MFVDTMLFAGCLVVLLASVCFFNSALTLRRRNEIEKMKMNSEMIVFHLPLLHITHTPIVIILVVLLRNDNSDLYSSA